MDEGGDQGTVTRKRLDRRTAALRFGQMALLPFAATVLPGRSLRAAAVPVDVAGRYRLARTLMRELGDGAAIVVTRAWDIRIEPLREGFAVSGRQVFAEVAAPPLLDQLAAMEQAQDAGGIFPMALDAAGLIRRSGAPMGGAVLTRGIDTARSLFAALPSPERRGEVVTFAAKLAGLGASAVGQPPRDLFFPRSGTQLSERTVLLPGGAEGTISVTVSAKVEGKSGLLATSERRIVTMAGPGRRLSSDRWILLSAS